MTYYSDMNNKQATILPKTARFELGRYSVVGTHHTDRCAHPYTVALFKNLDCRDFRHFDNRADATFAFEALRRAIERNNSLSQPNQGAI